MSESKSNMTTWLSALGVGGLVWYLIDRTEKARGGADPRHDERAFDDAPPSPPKRTVPPPSRKDLARVAPRTYDATFAMHGRGIPVAYLRALAMRESDLNPRQITGDAVGLLQVIDVVRRGFNDRHGTAYERRDLYDPAINVAIASDALMRIAAAYDRNHPEVPNLRPDWDNPRFVELLTFGWNAGFSERAGVGLVATTLVARRQRDLTIDDIHRAAKAAGASPNLSNPAKVRFAKAVTAQYLRERTRDETEGYAVPLVAVADADAPPASPVSTPAQADAQPAGVA